MTEMSIVQRDTDAADKQIDDFDDSYDYRKYEEPWPICKTCRCDIDGHELSTDGHEFVTMTNEEEAAYHSSLNDPPIL